MKLLIIAIILVVIQQNIKLAYSVSCNTNPCQFVAQVYEPSTGYCCTDLPSSTDSVCTCPNTAPVVNGPCRPGAGIGAGNTFCNRTCLNGGVCNTPSGVEVCWCTSGFSGTNCELQGVAGTCATGRCQAGFCTTETIGATTFSYCHCNPGWSGQSCDICYFVCTQAGIFPDTANCALGRYFYCPQASGAPIVATCPNGQKFNRLTKNCDATYNCT